MEEEKLVIKLESSEGSSCKKLYVNDDDKPIFKVSDTFSDDQIKEVYHLCHQFFGAGLRDGVVRVQNDLKRILGIA